MMDVRNQCHICGKITKLSYEHIPPRAAFNKIPRKMVKLGLISHNTQNDWSLTEKKYKSFQQGIGDYTLCEKCNSLTGSMYGVEYVKIVQSVGKKISQIPRDKRAGGLNIVIEKMNCLAFFKQIISMFSSINTVNFGTKFKDYLLNKNNNNFDLERYKVSMYLHHGNIDRINPMCLLWNPQDGKSKECSEISLFPFGFILYNLENVTDNNMVGMDITNWGRKEYKEEEVELNLPFLICNTGKTLDFL